MLPRVLGSFDMAIIFVAIVLFWRLWLALQCGVSALVALAIYAMSEYVRRRAPASPPLAPA